MASRYDWHDDHVFSFLWRVVWLLLKELCQQDRATLNTEPSHVPLSWTHRSLASTDSWVSVSIIKLLVIVWWSVFVFARSTFKVWFKNIFSWHRIHHIGVAILPSSYIAIHNIFPNVMNRLHDSCVRLFCASIFSTASRDCWQISPGSFL